MSISTLCLHRGLSCLFGILWMVAEISTTDSTNLSWRRDVYGAITGESDSQVLPSEVEDHENIAGTGSRNSTDTPFLVLVVVSRPEALHERMAIRRTWSAITTSCHMKTIFAFGGRHKMKKLQKALLEEQAAFNDIVIFDKLQDKYYSTFSLVVHALSWARQNYPSAKFYGKANDDVWINFPKIIQRLHRPTFGKDYFLGHFIDRTSEKARELYERFTVNASEPLLFAVGHLWITPSYTLDKVLRLASAHPPASTLVADIVITGEFRKYRHIEASNIVDYVDLWDLDEDAGCSISNYTLVHGVFSQQKYDFDSLHCLSNLICT